MCKCKLEGIFVVCAAKPLLLVKVNLLNDIPAADAIEVIIIGPYVLSYVKILN
jgi:hypothetical protein